MNEPMGTPPTPAPASMPEATKKNNTPLIIGIVVAVVLCCCCALVVGGWFYGDQVLQALNIQF